MSETKPNTDGLERYLDTEEGRATAGWELPTLLAMKAKMGPLDVQAYRDTSRILRAHCVANGVDPAAQATNDPHRESDENGDKGDEWAQVESALNSLSRRDSARIAVIGARAAILAYRAAVAAEIERSLHDLVDLEAWAKGGPVPARAKRFEELLQMVDSDDEAGKAASDELEASYWGHFEFLDLAERIVHLATGSDDRINLHFLLTEYCEPNLTPFQDAAIEAMQAELVRL